MTYGTMDNSKSVTEWLNSVKSEKTRLEYGNRFQVWLEYCKAKGLLVTGDLPLERISTLSVVGAGPFKKLAINTVRDNQSFGIPRHEFNVENPEKWMTEIEVARRTQKESMFTLQKEIRETTREIVKIKCTYCGMLVEQHLSRCPNCNSLIK